jgi:3-oxoacyl-[acyl-carrier-protein] synthase-3
MARYARIVATGRYVPKRRVTNKELEERYRQPLDEWLRENVGIAARHFAAPDEATSDLAAKAARVALERAGVQPEDVDLLIVATDTPDYLSPATASVVQHKLGISKEAGVFDVNNACAAFVTSVIIAGKFIAAEEHYNTALVIGAYAMSKFLDWQDYKTATVFADGAGAVVLKASDEPGLLSSKMLADGQYHDYMGIYAGGTFQPITPQLLEQREHCLKIKKRFPPDVNSANWPRLVRSVVEQAGYRVEDIQRVYFTQINVNTIKEVMQELALPLEKTHWIMDKWGYVGSACIAMALDDHIEQGKGPKPGDLVVLCASGGGYAMAALALRW